MNEIPDGDLWHLHQELKGLLIAQIDGYARARWQQDEVAACNVIAFGALLDPHILTLGFARRFTGYKRADLVLYGLERLKRLLTDPLRPVQIIFAGKAHPASQRVGESASRRVGESASRRVGESVIGEAARSLVG